MQEKDKPHISTQYDSNASLDELRKIILGLEPDELSNLQAWFQDENSLAEDIAHILPMAVLKSIEHKAPLGDTLMPIIEDAIFKSVENNPKALADALFPIMGPAIRKSISDALRGLVESLNQTLEKKFSTERIKWRMEAIFSSKSYAEIVLLKGLTYDVKHVFLIHKETGLLIQDFHKDMSEFDAADMVSSMLTAVQEFVKDSFGNNIDSSDTLDTIRLNDLNVWIENGPFAILAVVFEGNAPESNHELYKEILEKIHSNYAMLLKSFDGDTDKFIMLKPTLKSCFAKPEKPKANNKKLLFVFVIIMIVVGVFIGMSVNKRMKFSSFIESLEHYPSVVITKIDDSDGKYVILGMKDILASGFNKIADANGVDTNELDYHWVNYISLEDTFAIKRIKRALAANDNVKIYLKESIIIIEGKASEEWINAAKLYANSYLPPAKFDFSKLENSILDSMQLLKSRISKLSLIFPKGASYVNSKDKNQLDNVIQLYNKYLEYESQTKLFVSVYLDSEDDENVNRRIAKYRYKSVKKYLIAKGIKESVIDWEIKPCISEVNSRQITFKIEAKK